MNNNNNEHLSLRKFKGKKLVSFLRQGDYAHAGETEAIDRVMAKYQKNNQQLILDVGCGLGGTADYLLKNNWGKVYGFDIEQEAIDYAKEKYPDVDFFVSNVINVHENTDLKFDILCLFNAFYAFHDQSLALRSLAKVAKENAKLAIFDYLDPCKEGNSPLFRSGDGGRSPVIPIRIDNIKKMLLDNGWQLDELVDISADYYRWYKKIVDQLVENKDEVINHYGELAYNKAHGTYDREICTAILDKTFGGVIVYATKN